MKIETDFIDSFGFACFIEFSENRANFELSTFIVHGERNKTLIREVLDFSADNSHVFLASFYFFLSFFESFVVEKLSHVSEAWERERWRTRRWREEDKNPFAKGCKQGA